MGQSYTLRCIQAIQLDFPYDIGFKCRCSGLHARYTDGFIELITLAERLG